MASKNKDRPNIIFILSDDQGAWAMGCAGNPEIHTPNLDRLAATGMRFENFFCTSPVCSPARASLMTGKIPSQHGIHDWLRDGNIGENAIEFLKDQITYTDILAANGYICGISGKWHMGDSLNPQKSFSHWFVHQKGGGPYYNAPMIRNGELINESDYITDVITDDAINFLKEQAKNENPFYLSIHYTAPHSPWIKNHPKEIVDFYDECPFESCPDEPPHPWLRAKNIFPSTPEMRREQLKGYFAAITAMDINIGRIINEVERLRLRDNTLICFMSDNGFNCGHHGIWGKGNGTFPLNMFDTSVKIPAIFSQPGKIPQGVVCDALVSGYDFMPTLLEYVGIGINDSYEKELPGKSFVNFLLGKKGKERDSVVIYDEYGPVRMVRTKEWKYVHRYPYGPHELYDLVNDPNEKHNLIDEESKKDILIVLKAMLEDWFVRYVDLRLDGSHEAVTGSGQIGLAGILGEGKQAFWKLNED